MQYYFVILLFHLSLTISAQVTADDGLDIYLEDSKEGDTTLLFIHGWNLNHTFWQHQVDEFSGNYRCVAPDLPGYGASGKDRKYWSMKSYGSDIRSIIDQLNLKNVVLIAHSMGGNIALEAYAISSSEIIGIIGVDNFKEVGSVPGPAEEEQMEEFYKMLEEDYPRNVKLAAEGFMFHENSPPVPKEEILTTYAGADPGIAIPVFKAAYSGSSREAGQLESTPVPFALISSLNIPFNEEMFLEHYGGQRFQNFEIRNTGHFPMYEDPVAFNMALHRALDFMFKQPD